MKAVIIHSVCLALAITLAKPQTNAQKAGGNNQIVYHPYISPATRSGVSEKIDLPVKPTAMVDIPEKIIKTFKGKFSGENEVTWSKEGNLYMAIFKQNGTSNRVIFNKNGKILRTIIIICEAIDQLSPEVSELIDNNYPDFHVTNAWKVLQNNDSLWVVNLSGNCKPKCVVARIENGEIDELINFKNAR
jgi:hypothetical protein